jgi:hypothetical protein
MEIRFFYFFFPHFLSGMLKTVQCKLIAFLIAVFKVVGLRPHLDVQWIDEGAMRKQL